MILILLRHGQTKLNKLGLIQGRSDYPLNSDGKKEIKESVERLKKLFPNINYFFSSPLKRAIQTINIIKKAYDDNANVIIKDDLIERSFGALEMAPVSELPYFLEDNSIPGYENNLMLKERMEKFLAQIAEDYPKDAIILMATHSHTIKGILVNLFRECTYKDRIKNGEFVILNYDKINNTYTLQREESGE